ncbi:MAG: 7-cyano-7-deazaguanine synthase QueC [Candidatus Omnitrophica bacterium]|nr:7-cyano-7-deazaguanine synthase QueC [Candidatus Omnitrophota bacterium]
MKRAVVLLSGGLDSATTLYEARSQGYRCHCLIIDYGQRHRREVESAKRIAQAAGSAARVIRIWLPWGGSALTDRSIRVPVGRSLKKIGKGIPATYVPARNTVFLSYAASWAEAIGASAIFIGANAIDFSDYPDCRPNYYGAFRKVIRLGTKAGVEGREIRIATPLIRMTKAKIIRRGRKLKVPYELTWSCYAGAKRPCGRCDSCLLRAKGFREAGLRDPALV